MIEVASKINQYWLSWHNHRNVFEIFTSKKRFDLNTIPLAAFNGWMDAFTQQKVARNLVKNLTHYEVTEMRHYFVVHFSSSRKLNYSPLVRKWTVLIAAAAMIDSRQFHWFTKDLLQNSYVFKPLSMQQALVNILTRYCYYQYDDFVKQSAVKALSIDQTKVTLCQHSC